QPTNNVLCHNKIFSSYFKFQSSVVTTSHDCITIIPHFTLNVKHYFHFLFNYFYFFDTFYTKLVCILLALECRIVTSTNLYLTSQPAVITVIKLHSLRVVITP